ncbi:COP1-interactive protein 1-like [Impatiens glandulifera]|uniref:COP1-interactive protein 1-like n=1 Tax=Impatiens glandulifera TaxID=253017 RepID=UPI001FB0AB66|nr:COP1-interactive protein 1-like [Impatiens glandulifera]
MISTEDADSSEVMKKKQVAEEDDNRAPSKMEELTIQSENLKQEMNTLQIQKGELGDGGKDLNDTSIEKTTQEVLQFLGQIESLKDELKKTEREKGVLEKKLQVLEKVQQQEVKSLKDENKQLEEQMERMKEKGNQMEEHKKSIQDQREVMLKLEAENKKLKSKCTESKQTIEKKMEETIAEFRKTFEDQIRMLSRRIHVAEQLHLENREVYRKTKEKFENEDEDLKDRVVKTEVAFKKMKDISLWANNTLSRMDIAALKFEESSGNFLNRISKSSCEVLFARDWVRRKKNGVKHSREEMECLLEEMNGKETEILKFRESVWKLEHRNRELEKMVKEKEEGMVALGEEKREAIRQLCVWIDYHRSSKHYLEKIIVSERMNE